MLLQRGSGGRAAKEFTADGADGQRRTSICFAAKEMAALVILAPREN